MDYYITGWGKIGKQNCLRLNFWLKSTQTQDNIKYLVLLPFENVLIYKKHIVGWQYDLSSTGVDSEGGCVWPKLLYGGGERDGGEGGGELDVGADRDGADAEHAGVLRQLVVRLIQRQAGLHQRLQAVDE